jgi:hypothetical protein
LLNAFGLRLAGILHAIWPAGTQAVKEALMKAAASPLVARRIGGWPEWRTVVVSPLLYGMIVPLIVLDLALELYHRVVFPVLGIPLVRRGEYIKIDRHLLPYLSPILKVACAYCGYANGLLHYAVRIAGDTEIYFCPIKHETSPGFRPPLHHQSFLEYGDAEGFRRLWERRKRKNPRGKQPTLPAPAGEKGTRP